MPPVRINAGSCLPGAPLPGPGVVDPFHVPAAAATQLNADAKVLYRQGLWDDARTKYRAAEAADPDFLAPALNIACSFVRQERFADAVAEVLRLLDKAYTPWSDEIVSAADLGALKVWGEGKQLHAALESGRLKWAADLVDDVILLARTRPPLKLGTPTASETTLILGPRQEVFAWSPRTRRYRQLTSEEGRVLAVARSADAGKIAYLTAEKLVRAPGDEVALRGLVVKELDLRTLSFLGHSPVEGDVRRIDIFLAGGNGFTYRISRASTTTSYQFRNESFQPRPAPRFGAARVSLSGHGVAPAESEVPVPAGCAASMRDVRTGDGAVSVQVHRRGRGPVIQIGGPFGASLAGLPIP
jgi:hypothetical protein